MYGDLVQVFFFQGTCSPIGLVRQPTEEHLQHHHPLRYATTNYWSACIVESPADPSKEIPECWITVDLLCLRGHPTIFLRLCIIDFLRLSSCVFAIFLFYFLHFFYFFRQALAAGFSLEGFLSGFPSFFAPNRIETLRH